MKLGNVFGIIGRDPKMNSNGTVIMFSIAVKRRYKDNQSGQYESDWFNCKAFGKTAELVNQNFHKGSKILFDGDMRNNNYEKNGQKVYSNEIVVSDITFIESKQAANDDNRQVGRTEPFPTSAPDLFGNNGVTVDPDDLPF